MDEQRKVWEQMPGESGRWYARFTRYREMGPDRSLLAAVNEMRDQKGQKRSCNTPGAWRRISFEYQWKVRAEAWDEFERQRKELQAKQDMQEARQKLAAAASKAVDVLAGQLGDGGAGVQKAAADDILDRAGIVTVEKMDVTTGGEALHEPRLSDAERALALAGILERLRGDAGRRGPAGDDQPGS
ncbi:MAG: hypothetical protein WC869_10595 [Phycisphaerae bacterium]